MNKVFCAWCGKIIPDFDLNHCLKIDDNCFCLGKSCYINYVTHGKSKLHKQQLLDFIFGGSK